MKFKTIAVLTFKQGRTAYMMRFARFKTLLVVAATCVILATPVRAATVEAKLRDSGSRIEAPPFTLADASGKILRLTDLRGKVVVVNFWATDCGGCRIEIPWFVDIDQVFKNERVAVIGVSMDISYEDLKNAHEAWAKVTPFVAAHQMRYPILMDDGEVSKRYDTQALPVTVLIDTRGRIAATYVGLIDKKNVEDNIKTLLTENQYIQHE